MGSQSGSESKSYYVTARDRLNRESRVRKAQQIKAILKDFVTLEQSNVLDVGTSAGYIAESLSEEARTVTSVDINDERKTKQGYEFILTENAEIPVSNSTFDIVVSSHVIEHVPEQERHVEEIFRVLKPGGIAYLATPNKYGLIEPHYKLPLLSWLPRSASAAYLKLIKGEKWNIYPLSYRNIQQLTQDKFNIHNHTIQALQQPQKYHIHTNKVLQNLFNRTPLTILSLINPFAPAYIVILTKPQN